MLRLVVPALGFPSAPVGYRPSAAGRRASPSTRSSRMLRLTRRQPDRLLRRAAAPGHLVRPRRRARRDPAARLRAQRLRQRHATVPGWTSTFVVVAAVGAVQLLCLGLLGEYVGRLYTQMQGRPSYFVARDSRGRAERAGRTAL